MGVGGGLGAAGILLLVLSFIGLGVGFYYAYMCIQSKPRRKRSPHDPEHGPLISADPDVNGNHEDSLVASAPLPYIPKSKIDEPDSSDEKAVLQTKKENALGVEKSESVLVPIEAVTPTVEETAEAAVPVVVIPPESMPEYKDVPKVDCPVTKSAESAPTLENGAAPCDCDLPVPIIMNAAFAVAKPITDSDEEDGLLLQKRLHHDDSLESEPVPPLVPIAHSISELEKTSAPKEEPSAEDVDEPIPSAPPKESTPDAASETVLPTAPPKAITPELPVTSDENAQPSAPPEEVTIESPTSNVTKDSPIVDEVQPEDGVVYLETYKPTASEPIDATVDDNIKEENSSTESSPEELAHAGDPVAEVENKTEVTETEPVAEVDSETSEQKETVVIDPSMIDKNSYGWSEGVVPTDPSSYGWSNDVKKVETELVKSSFEPVDCNIGKPVITEEHPASTENKDLIIDNEPKLKDELLLIPPVVVESVVPLSHDKQQLEPESSDKSVDTSIASISSEEAVPPYTESAEAVKIVIPTDSSNYGWSNDVENVETDEIIIPLGVVEGESAVPLSHTNSVNTENVSSSLEPELSVKSVDISNASISSEEAVPPYTVSAETAESTEETLDQMVPTPEAMSVITVPKDETSPVEEDEVDKLASPKDTEPEIETSETEPLAHVLSKVETSSDKEASAESTLNTDNIPKEVSFDDKETEESTQQVEDAPIVTPSSQVAETEIKPQERSVPNHTLSSELKGESTLESQVEEPIARNEIASLESLPEKIETENTDHISPVEDAQTALAEQHHTDHSDTESSEPDVTEYSFSTGPTDESTAKVLGDEVSSSLEPEVTKYRTLPISDDTAAAGDPVFSSVAATAVTVTECDTDSASSISLSSDDEADDNSEGNKADSDISLSTDDENTSKVELDKGISNEVTTTTTAEETDTQKEISIEKKNEDDDDTDSDGAENPKEMKEELVEVVQVVQEVEEKDVKDNEEEEKEVVNHDVPRDSDSDDSDSDDDDKSTASSNSDDSESDKVPCVKKSKIPRLKSKQSNV